MENRNDILNELKELSPTLAAIEKVNVFTVPEGYFEYLGADMLLRIEKENGLTDHAVNDVPAGYFDGLATSILAKIKAQETEEDEAEEILLSPQLSAIQHTPTFEVPAGYFDGLADSILGKIKAADTEDAATEIKALSPMLYSIQNENVLSVPAGYFESLSETILNKVKPAAKVVAMKSRTATFFKYAVAAVFTGVMALGVYQFTGNSTKENELPDYVKVGMNDIKDVDQELAKISEADIIKYLEANGTDVKATMVANSVDKNELPTEEDYLLDEQALDKYLNSINIDDLKN